jgi:putative membrane protein
MMGGDGSMMGWMWLFWLLLIIGILLLGIVVVRALSGGITGGGTGPGATDAGIARRILDERYARGELSTEEYRERREVLGDGT